jgi:cardiolipin synthase
MQELWQAYSPYLISLIYAIALIYAVVSLLLENKNPLKTHSYLLLLLLLPVIGIIIYFFFGQNVRKRKIFQNRKLINFAFGEKYVNQHLDNKVPLDIPEPYRPLPQYDKLVNFLSLDLSPLTMNNKVQVLKNGEEKFPLLKKAILKAKDHIHIEYYILSDDDIGRTMGDLLIQKAQEGLRVRIIVDGVGSLGLSRKFFKKNASWWCRDS